MIVRGKRTGTEAIPSPGVVWRQLESRAAMSQDTQVRQ